MSPCSVFQGHTMGEGSRWVRAQVSSAQWEPRASAMPASTTGVFLGTDRGKSVWESGIGKLAPGDSGDSGDRLQCLWRCRTSAHKPGLRVVLVPKCPTEKRRAVSVARFVVAHYLAVSFFPHNFIERDCLFAGGV